MNGDFLKALAAGHHAGQGGGITSWCTAHPDVLRCILRAHATDEAPVLIEATCNQVNQEGGYTGMTPGDFRCFVEGLAHEAGIDPQRIILGGDHLGPNPWRHLPAGEAMSRAREMVRAYVGAGFAKIHLDASMACADDGVLSTGEIARRSADLCAIAEEAAGAVPPVYIIGTEVPVPGGESEKIDALAATKPEAALGTYAEHRDIFGRMGLSAAFARVVGLVVQPGVDFGNEQIFAFDAARAADLSAALPHMPGLVYEAHSTDYQSPEGLAGLVDNHFAILKVGPELTFAYREALFALAAMDSALGGASGEGLFAAIVGAMAREPKYWRAYVPPGGRERLLQLYGLSDRLRYYWPQPELAAAVRRLCVAIDTADVPPGLLWQYAGHLPESSASMPLSARIIDAKIGAVVRKYRRACGD